MSGRKRFFIDTIDYPKTQEVILDGDEFVLAKTVQRVEEGSEIILLDGSGQEYTAIVAKVEKRSLTAHIIKAETGDREPNADIYLLCGALKGDKTELVVQKACELGASKIGIFSSEYCSAFMNENKLERLNKVAREAAKQCMRSRAPLIEYFDNLEDALQSAQNYNNKLFACEFIATSESDISTIDGSTALVVGSEGGFSQEEYALSESLGFSGITLGKRILRAETAAISLLAVTAFALGELK
ncbi:MAG: 16S rRNA (uracil(1498)-N(3))-methyltransferase [Clostridia bacterium]|nr:16S rRNA (uracil(1498)-N(3))-methyltransferase [Clostridia bacterium]